MSVGNNILHDSVATLNISNHDTIAPLVDILEKHSKTLAADEESRRTIGNNIPSIWPDLRHLWVTTAAAHESIGDDEDEGERGEILRSLCVGLARFTRNLVAAVPENQIRAFENEGSIRNLMRYYTSFTVNMNPESFIATRMLTQALCNIVTANETLIAQLWEMYLQLPEEQLILIRLITTQDAGTALASFVLILNCLHGSSTRMALLTTRASGSRLCITYLDRMASLFDAADKDSEQAFEIGYGIFSRWAEEGFVPAIYARIGIAGEVITPHQTTLLKLLDAYLLPSNLTGADALGVHLPGLCKLLTTTFYSLANYAQQSIRRALGSNKRRSQSGSLVTDDGRGAGAETHVGVDDPLPVNGLLDELDLLLPKVCEALVLVTQGLISLALFSEEVLNTMASTERANDTPGSPTGMHLKHDMNHAVSEQGVGLIETLVETLRLLDLFLPRITFGKVANPPGYVGELGRSSDEGAGKHAILPHPQASDPKGFSYLKRDLVRLLGILAADCRDAQERVRICGGITVVLNLCVIDDRNPYLREHAIFTLRNILHGNLENQAVVNEIQPLGEWEKPAPK